MMERNRNSAPSIRVGLFGGTFNPIHRGHIAVAEDVLSHYNLDRIHFIPSALPPHKAPAAIVSANHRLAMARLALRGRQRFSISDMEVQRRGPSYTIETLRRCSTDQTGARRFFFIVGMDAFLEIHTWKAYLQLFEETAFIIMSRPHSGRPVKDFGRAIQAYVCRHISEDYRWSSQKKVLRHPILKPLYLAEVKPVDIASTRIREAVRRGHAIDQWVDPSVADYIQRKGLYR
jgi:nicotinate-nucleotide adenylyltransferase